MNIFDNLDGEEEEKNLMEGALPDTFETACIKEAASAIMAKLEKWDAEFLEPKDKISGPSGIFSPSTLLILLHQLISFRTRQQTAHWRRGGQLSTLHLTHLKSRHYHNNNNNNNHHHHHHHHHHHPPPPPPPPPPAAAAAAAAAQITASTTQ